jgi:hypothetical protein
MDSLQKLMDAVPELHKKGISNTAPLPRDALINLRRLPTESNPLLSTTDKAQAWFIQGTVGYVAGKTRPDVQLAFVAISQQFANNCTAYTRACVFQVALYLLGTRDLTLNFVPPPAPRGDPMHLQLEGFSDSSALNGDPGQSWGGGGLASPGSGLISWKAHAPKKPTDSSGAAELIAATFLTKYIQGTRMLAKETNLRDSTPWTLNLDATATLSGVEMERVSDKMRYVSARLAMLRYAQDDSKDIVLKKVDTKLNTADGFTKSLAGADLVRNRALMLGHPR